jgi:hypothetical protein
MDNALQYRPNSREDRKVISRVGVMPGPCNNYGRVRGDTAPFIRGVAAEYWLHADFDLIAGKQRHKARKIFTVPTEAERNSMSPDEKRALSFVEYGTCVARADMSNLSRLFATEVGSASETQAFNSLGPVMGQCLLPGVTIKMNSLKLRGYLAEGAYRHLAEAGAR